MARGSGAIAVYLEVGAKRVFAGAVEWPGWSRSGRGEEAALQALVESGPRYGRALHAAGIAFEPPADVAGLDGVERLGGNATTDFGAPDFAPKADERPVDATGYERFRALLEAYWQEFDRIVEAATGKELRKGPRGGGRDLDGVVRHVLGADAGYLRHLAPGFRRDEVAPLNEELARTRQAILDALATAERGELPERGPRGGTIWTPRYFVRRVAWHVLDHAWEIEDRVV